MQEFCVKITINIESHSAACKKKTHPLRADRSIDNSCILRVSILHNDVRLFDKQIIVTRAQLIVLDTIAEVVLEKDVGNNGTLVDIGKDIELASGIVLAVDGA